jgi:lysozyme
MTSPYLLADLERDEGFREHAYPDPLSGGEPFTVGFGFTGPHIGPDTTMTLEEARTELAKRVGQITAELRAHLPWFNDLSDLRQDCLVNAAFNLGVAGLLSFHNTLAAIQRYDYPAAASGFLHSLWARQVGQRAVRIARQMATNIHQA